MPNTPRRPEYEKQNTHKLSMILGNQNMYQSCGIPDTPKIIVSRQQEELLLVVLLLIVTTITTTTRTTTNSRFQSAPGYGPWPVMVIKTVIQILKVYIPVEALRLGGGWRTIRAHDTVSDIMYHFWFVCFSPGGAQLQSDWSLSCDRWLGYHASECENNIP